MKTKMNIYSIKIKTSVFWWIQRLIKNPSNQGNLIQLFEQGVWML